MDSRRRVYLSDVIEASNRLDELVLWILRSRGELSQHQIVHEIFSTHSFVPSPQKIEKLLNDLEQQGYIKREKNGLVSVYSLTEKGQEVANGKTEKVNFLRE